MGIALTLTYARAFSGLRCARSRVHAQQRVDRHLEMAGRDILFDCVQQFKGLAHKRKRHRTGYGRLLLI